MPWLTEARGRIVADWNAGEVLQHTDPYLVWLDLSRFAGAGLPKKRLVPVIEQTQHELRYRTHAHEVDALIRLADPELRKADGVLRFELAAGVVSDDVLQAPQAPTAAQIESWHAPRRAGGKPVIGFIDYGCAFAHRQWRSPSDPLATRVKALWDQGGCTQLDAVALQWQTPTGFWYGAETHRDLELAPDSGALTLNGWMRRHTHAGVIDEEACYRHSRYAPIIGKRHSHGTHSMDLATGWPNPLRHIAAGATAAHDADIVFVQLPRHVEREPVSGLLRANVYDALRYIIDCTPNKQPCVINLGYGANAGPHDGSSLLEQAMDWRVERALEQRGVTVHLVVAAGNARDSAMHAMADIAPLGEAVFEWHNLPDDPSDSFVEIWFPRQDDDFSLGITAPGGGAPVAVTPGHAISFDNEGVAAALVFPQRACQSPRGTMALLAVSRTRPWPHRVIAPYGAWRITVRNGSTKPARVHAWCERDIPAFGSEGQPRQSRFVDTPTSRVERDGTLNSMAHGLASVVVGGHVGGHHVAAYSGTGPGRELGPSASAARERRTSARGQARRRGPDLLAPSDESAALPGLLAAALIGSDRVRLDGTSAAAALVTRAIVDAGFKVPGRKRGPPQATKPEQHPDTDLLP